MMELSYLFQIDGEPVVPPDSDMAISFEDLDSSDSGRDEAGVMHRVVIRFGVGKWEFVYSFLTPAEYAHMESLLSGKAHFQFTFPDPATHDLRTVTAYRSKHSITWENAVTGKIRNYKFNITEC